MCVINNFKRPFYLKYKFDIDTGRLFKIWRDRIMIGSITISKNSNDVIRIKIRDENSRIDFCKLEMTQDQFTSALFGLAETSCLVYVDNLKNVGKKKEVKPFKFEIPNNLGNWAARDVKEIKKIANSKCPEGWEVNHYYNSQKTFTYQGEKKFVNTSIVRWV